MKTRDNKKLLLVYLNQNITVYQSFSNVFGDFDKSKFMLYNIMMKLE